MQSACLCCAAAEGLCVTFMLLEWTLAGVEAPPSTRHCIQIPSLIPLLRQSSRCCKHLVVVCLCAGLTVCEKMCVLLQVLRFLQAFAGRYHLQQLVRFNARVVRATPLPAATATASAAASRIATAAAGAAGDAEAAAGGCAVQQQTRRWQVQWQELSVSKPVHPSTHASGAEAAPEHGKLNTAAAGQAATSGAPQAELHSQVFDAVLVCNGHYTEPNLPQLPGAQEFPGLLMHSHNYRQADAFKRQHVAVVGASYSGMTAWCVVARELWVCGVCTHLLQLWVLPNAQCSVVAPPCITWCCRRDQFCGSRAWPLMLLQTRCSTTAPSLCCV